MTDLRDIGEVSTGDLVDGRYLLEARIGEGAMATVYRGEDTLLKRMVAVKVMRAHLDDLTSIERAHSETTLLASLNHHALVTLFDARVSEDDGSYLVMEYVQGPTLRDRIAQGPIDQAEAASLTVDIAEALYVAHTAGIVHRDIKPSNVLLWRSPVPGREWRAKVADFGIAHLLDSSRLTVPGTIVGTAAYVAPEQARGAAPAPPADIYALGLVLIEALTGRRPFADAEGIGTIMARLAAPPDVPDSLPSEWQQLLRWMTATAPADRPTALDVVGAASRLMPQPAADSADAVTAAVARFTEVALPTAVTSAPTAVLPPVPSGPEALATAALSEDVPPHRRRPWMLAGVILAALLLAAVIGTVLGLTSQLGAADPSPTEPTQQQVVEPSVEPEPVVEEPAPVDNTVVDDNSGSGNGNSGNGNGNSGNGKGNGNGGKGKGKG